MLRFDGHLVKASSYIYAAVRNTTGFNIKELHVVCVVIGTAIISLYGIKLLVVRKGVFTARYEFSLET